MTARNPSSAGVSKVMLRLLKIGFRVFLAQPKPMAFRRERLAKIAPFLLWIEFGELVSSCAIATFEVRNSTTTVQKMAKREVRIMVTIFVG